MRTYVYSPIELAEIFMLREALDYVENGTLVHDLEPTFSLDDLEDLYRLLMTGKELVELGEEDYESCLKEPTAEELASAKIAREDHVHAVSALKAKLFLALRDGRLKAYGKRMDAHREYSKDWQYEDAWVESLESDTNKESITLSQTKEVISGNTINNYSVIDQSFWSLEGIDWQSSQARSPQCWYKHIFVSFENLRNVFPPENQEPEPVEAFGKYYVSYSDSEKITSGYRRKREPTYDWPSFQAEITRYIVLELGKFPKQTALISYMEKWCKNEWGKIPSYGAIQAQLKPHYKDIKKTSNE